MAENRSASSRVFIPLAAGALVVMVVALALLIRTTAQPSLPKSVPNEVQRAYLPNIVVTDARMSVAEYFLGGTVTFLDARLTNKGTKAIRRLEIELKFVDALGQVVLRDTARPITARTPPLKPGETRAFRVSFEHMPVDWNQTPPAFTPTYVEF